MRMTDERHDEIFFAILDAINDYGHGLSATDAYPTIHVSTEGRGHIAEIELDQYADAGDEIKVSADARSGLIARIAKEAV